MRDVSLVFRWLNGVLEWSRVDKCMFLMAFVLPLVGQYSGWMLYVMSRDDAANLIDVAFARTQWPVYGVLAAVVTALAVLGLFLRKRKPQSLLYEGVTLATFTATLLYYGWLIGPLNIETGVAMIGTPVIGLILLDRFIVLACWLVACVVLLALVMGSAYGVLPYAPLLVRPLPGDMTYTMFWALTHLFWVVPLIAFTMVIALFALIRWQHREQVFRTLSHTDGLTGVHNRRSVLDFLDGEVARAKRSGQPLSVMIADLDHFKKVNDNWGHPVGDRVLQAVARALAETVREYDVVGRYGGEEFLLVLPNATLDTAQSVAERCRERLLALDVRANNGERVPIAGSFGLVCSSGLAGVSTDVLVQRADQALYRAKQSGRNRVEIT